MNSTNILIITVILAILMVGGAVAFAVMSGQGGTAGTAAEAVTVESAHRQCVSDRDCMVVETHCGYCGGYDSIAIIHEGVFNTIFNNQCGTYGGKLCSNVELNGYPACRDGQCALVNLDGGL